MRHSLSQHILGAFIALVLFLIPFTLTLIFFPTKANADTYVNGYYKDNGTYVQPHYRSSSDGSTYNNYSSQGNVNPYTGEEGTANTYHRFGNMTYDNYGHSCVTIGNSVSCN